ncbi:MAG TPA: hypothetical protein ENH70_07665 [Desulfobacteraceae bacterium]|nr:MAG: hypothetical protein DRG82_11300 [Deltaproteobacteria bacterium]HDZ24396.1 hypothetical protein [Desulfobacteraceae bacterium]
MKMVWLSALVKAEDVVKKLILQLKPYGLGANGHFWEDDLDKMAWIGPRKELLDGDTSLWGILGSADNFQEPTVRYGLSLLATTLQAQKGHEFPILILLTEGSLEPETLPTPLRNSTVIALTDPGLGAKLVALVHRPPAENRPEYRLDVYGNAQIGQWFEVGPVEGTWSGAMFGVSDGDITFQAVGPKGSLPSQSTLNYPMQGLKMNLGDREFTAWAVKNQIEPAASYFVKVEGQPERILFGPFSDEDQTDVFVVDLK